MPRKYKKKSNRGSCNMTYKSSYRTPCQALPLDADFAIQEGGNVDLDSSRGCSSYSVDVSQQIAGRPIISGNPSDCLSTQMSEYSTFSQPTQQVGGNASCSGVGFDLSSPIAGNATIVNYAPNCLHGEVSRSPNPILSGGSRKKKIKIPAEKKK